MIATLDKYDAIIIGSGPNGFSAAIELAKAGWTTKIVEASNTIGGGLRTGELTRSGFKHDICSAIHPLAAGSPFFRSLPLEEHGIEWIYPEYPLAHPLDNGETVILHHSIDKTASQFGSDANSYKKLMSPFATNWEKLIPEILGPLHFPRHPVLMGRFGLKAVQSAKRLAFSHFQHEKTRALFAGLAAHSILPLEHMLTSAIGIVLGFMGHATGWPLPKGGSQEIAGALSSYYRHLNGTIETNKHITSLEELPDKSVKLFDVTPQQLLNIAGDRLPRRYRKQLERYRYGAGIFKFDAALDGPIPWKNPECAKAGTVHLGGDFGEIAASERTMWEGQHSPHPYVLLAQQSLFDGTRAPGDQHTVWAYCHVPNSSIKDMRTPIINQIERFAPGFKNRIIETHTYNTAQLHRYNPNYIGGDINGGPQTLSQLFTRPSFRLRPYATPLEDVYICSSSTPPGGGVHGMCGYHAAQTVLKKHGRR